MLSSEKMKKTMKSVFTHGRDNVNAEWYKMTEDEMDLLEEQLYELIDDYFDVWAKRERIIDEHGNDIMKEDTEEVIEEEVGNEFTGNAVILEEKPDINGNIMRSVKVVKISEDTLDITEEELKKDYDYERYHGEGNQLEDNYHTMSELYYHRMLLFITILKLAKEKGYELYKSKLHHDGTKIDDYFIVGVFTPEGQYAYHYNLKYWDYFNFVDEWDRAPEWDGQQAEDLHRLLTL